MSMAVVDNAGARALQNSSKGFIEPGHRWISVAQAVTLTPRFGFPLRLPRHDPPIPEHPPDREAILTVRRDSPRSTRAIADSTGRRKSSSQLGRVGTAKPAGSIVLPVGFIRSSQATRAHGSGSEARKRHGWGAQSGQRERERAPLGLARRLLSLDTGRARVRWTVYGSGPDCD
jgi:hypothetical protein